MEKIIIPINKPVNHTLEGLDYDGSIDIYTVDTKLYQNAWITPSGVAFKHLKMLPDTYPLMEWAAKEFRKIMYVNYFTRLRHYLPKNQNYLLAYNIWTVGNSPSAGYYHWVAESMPRIMANFDNLPHLSLLLPERAKKVPFIQDSLAYFPFKDVVYIPEKRLTQAPNLWVTSYLHSIGLYHRSLLEKVRHFLWEKTSHISSPFGRRVYVSRAKARARKVINEVEIIPILKEFGFDIVFFEDLTFSQQVACMRNTSHFVTLHGAALTNILCMHTQTNVMELMRETQDPFLLYLKMCTILHLNYYIQFCNPVNPQDIFDVADVTINPAEFKRNLETMFLDRK